MALKDLKLTCTAVEWRLDSERREPRCHPSEKSSHTVPPASSCSTARTRETRAENTKVTYSRHNTVIDITLCWSEGVEIWKDTSLLTLALRRQNWTHWTAIKQHGMGWFWLLQNSVMHVVLRKKSWKGKTITSVKTHKKENYPNVCSLINDTVTLHIKELWCSVGDGAPLSGPILIEKV